MNFVTMLWIFPAVIVTLHTAIALAFAWHYPMGKRVPVFISMHYMLMIVNGVDGYVNARPSWRSTLLFVALGLIPVTSAMMLVDLVWRTIDMSVAEFKYRKERKHLSNRSS